MYHYCSYFNLNMADKKLLLCFAVNLVLQKNVPFSPLYKTAKFLANYILIFYNFYKALATQKLLHGIFDSFSKSAKQ